MRDGDASQLCQFERDVLDDVAEVSAFAQPLHKTSLALLRAPMFCKTGQRLQQQFVETWKFTALSLNQFFQAKLH
ncbi:MAG: hypothetical protein JMDDDDMK_04202 [Acidobacteria bacterium]|nr:hypothetical protein [Acidobacteriota bacterium]